MKKKLYFDVHTQIGKQIDEVIENLWKNDFAKKEKKWIYEPFWNKKKENKSSDQH